MSSIFSTQNRQTFLRRKYCFFWVATALSPPVGRCDALPGLPLGSGMALSLLRRQARQGRARDRPRGRRFGHLLCKGWLRRNRHGRGIQGALSRPLVPFLLALVQTLQGLVDTHRE